MVYFHHKSSWLYNTTTRWVRDNKRHPTHTSFIVGHNDGVCTSTGNMSELSFVWVQQRKLYGHRLDHVVHYMPCKKNNTALKQILLVILLSYRYYHNIYTVYWLAELISEVGDGSFHPLWLHVALLVIDSCSVERWNTLMQCSCSRNSSHWLRWKSVYSV